MPGAPLPARRRRARRRADRTRSPGRAARAGTRAGRVAWRRGAPADRRDRSTSRGPRIRNSTARPSPTKRRDRSCAMGDRIVDRDHRERANAARSARRERGTERAAARADATGWRTTRCARCAPVRASTLRRPVRIATDARPSGPRRIGDPVAVQAARDLREQPTGEVVVAPVEEQPVDERQRSQQEARPSRRRDREVCAVLGPMRCRVHARGRPRKRERQRLRTPRRAARP